MVALGLEPLVKPMSQQTRDILDRLAKGEEVRFAVAFLSCFWREVCESDQEIRFSCRVESGVVCLSI